LQNTCGFNAQLSRGTGRIGVMHFGVESAGEKSTSNGFSGTRLQYFFVNKTRWGLVRTAGTTRGTAQ
ncbi:MAG: hypothetical protein AB2807_09425, partial [Candidatus Sedimenticola endophacoides]